IGGSDDWGVGKNYSVTCDGARTETIGGLMNVLANHVSETWNTSCTRTVGAAQAITSAKAIVGAVGAAKDQSGRGANLGILRKAKSESCGAGKVLVTGFMKEQSGADIGLAAKGAIAINVGGPIVEQIGGDFIMGASVVSITTGSASMKAGGSKMSV